MQRLLDILVAVVGLVLLAPLFAVVAVLIKLTSPGPVFFLQERIGRGFRPFWICKFRTMRDGPAEPPRRHHHWRRPADHADRPDFAKDEDRRISAVDQRAERRDEPRRPPARTPPLRRDVPRRLRDPLAGPAGRDRSGLAGVPPRVGNPWAGRKPRRRIHTATSCRPRSSWPRTTSRVIALLEFVDHCQDRAPAGPRPFAALNRKNWTRQQFAFDPLETALMDIPFFRPSIHEDELPKSWPACVRAG